MLKKLEHKISICNVNDLKLLTVESTVYCLIQQIHLSNDNVLYYINTHSRMDLELQGFVQGIINVWIQLINLQ